MSIEKRAAKRRKRMVAHRAAGFKEADRWDLDYWLSLTPQQRLSALVAIRRDVLAVQRGKQKALKDRDQEVADDGLDS
jgi:hypothetical protein